MMGWTLRKDACDDPGCWSWWSPLQVQAMTDCPWSRKRRHRIALGRVFPSPICISSECIQQARPWQQRGSCLPSDSEWIQAHVPAPELQSSVSSGRRGEQGLVASEQSTIHTKLEESERCGMPVPGCLIVRHEMVLPWTLCRCVSWAASTLGSMWDKTTASGCQCFHQQNDVQ